MTTEEMLRSMVERLVKINDRQSRQIDELTQQVKDLSAQVAWCQRQAIGRKGEKRSISEVMPGLFGEDAEGDRGGGAAGNGQ